MGILDSWGSKALARPRGSERMKVEVMPQGQTVCSSLGRLFTVSCPSKASGYQSGNCLYSFAINDAHKRNTRGIALAWELVSDTQGLEEAPKLEGDKQGRRGAVRSVHITLICMALTQNLQSRELYFQEVKLSLYQIPVI